MLAMHDATSYIPIVHIVEKRKKENEMRLIDADALIEFCAERWIPLNIDAVNMQPTIQPEPKEGHWIWVAGELMCSECRTIYSDLYPDYDNSVACPHCGAKMTISTK